jgi:uroporphyrinogen III methyltransferase/synthase
MNKVYLVGAGPGDPELITVKGHRVLEVADAVLYDHLANEALLDLAPLTAERLYVGKKKADHTFSQGEIVRMMIERARAGKTVVRLKGGDPFIFGRGGEEVEALAEAGIDFEVVPGVTAPLGLAAYCGIPLTHRDHTSVVTFVTGHETDAIDWSRVATSETLVIFMGLSTFGEIARKLMEAGRSGDSPAAAVRWATRPEQRTITATLAELPARIAQAGLKPPATIVIGDVVRLGGKLGWYERLPLFGQRVVVTRAQGQAGDLSARLRSLGAAVVEFATIAIREAEDYSALDTAIARLETYDWVLFTSVNGVRFFLERLDRSERDLRSLRGRIGTIGPATRQAVERLHLKVDLVPRDYVAEGLVAAFAQFDLGGKRILLPRAKVARDLIPKELTHRGAEVDVVEAYRTELPEYAAMMAREVFTVKPDWITFTSSSTVKNLVAAAGRSALNGVKIASIGPVTSETARSQGLDVTVEASRYTLEGLVEALVARSGARP